MQVLYRTQGGASDFEVEGERYAREEWEKLRGILIRLLTRRKLDSAVTLFERLPWTVKNATNGFGDEFGVLYAIVPLELYADNAHLPEHPGVKAAAEILAKTLSEIQPEHSYIRHVAYALSTSADAELVPSPEPAFTSEIVQRALADAEHLVSAGRAVSAVDRVHTAFVGYLRQACKESGIAYTETDSLSALLKRIAKDNEALSDQPHAEQILKVLRSAGAILAEFDPLRNRGSIAHDNEELLAEPEAQLVVNMARSLIHYLNARLVRT